MNFYKMLGKGKLYLKIVQLGLFLFIAFNSIAQSNPSSVSGLTVWLAADSTMVLSGSSVQQWSDISGNNNHFNSPNIGFNPTIFNSSTLNGKPYLNFDGTDKLESINSFSLSNTTIFIVSSQNTGDLSFGRLLDHGYDIGFWIGNGGSNTIGGGFKEASAPYGNFELLPVNTPCIISYNRNGAVTNYLKNTIPFSIPSRTTAGTATNFNKIILGASTVGGDFGRKNVFEVIIYNRSLTSAEMNVVNNYLKTKYAQSLSLGPDITSPNLCASTLTAPIGFTNLLWSTGETSSTISVNTSGEYWLQGTDVLGFVSRDSIQVNYPNIQGPSTSGICPGSSINWSTNLTSPYTFLWNTGATTPSLNISIPGNYWVQVTDSMGCSLTSDTLTFTIDDYANTATLGNDTSLCSGNTIGLQVGASSTVSYLWQNGATTPTIPILTSGTYSLQATNINGCLVYDTIIVTISGIAPNALFSAGSSCQLSALSFVNQSVGSVGDPVTNWSWDFGDGQSSSIENPSNIYLNEGVYPVQLNILSAGGCGASYSQNITVFKNPTVNFQVLGTCTGLATDFFDLTAVGDTSLSSFLWNFGQPSLGAANTSSLQNPSLIFQNGGLFPITLTVTDHNGCIDDSLVQFQMNQSPVASFTFNEVCTGQTINFVNTSSFDPSSSLLWNFGDGTTSTGLNPSKTYIGFGNRNVSLQISSTNGCANTFSQNLVVHPFPNPSMLIGPKCIGTYVQLTDQSTINLGSIDSVYWVFNQNDTMYGNTAKFLIPDGNQQQIQIFVKSDFSCQSTLSQFFTASQPLEANFNLSTPIVVTGSPILFQNTSIGGQIFDWNFGDGNTSSLSSPSHTFNTALNDSIISVTLIAQTTSGCVDTVIRTIELQTSQLDLEIGNLFFQPNNKFAIIGVELINNGTVGITEADLKLYSENGLQFQEKWIGSLQPNEKTVYVLKTQPYYNPIEDDNLQSFYCVEGSVTKPNETETDITNNRYCISIEGKSTILMTVYPNPVIADFKLNLLISEKSLVRIDLLDASGREIQRIFNNDTFEKGLYEYEISTSAIEAGVYFIRLISNEQVTLQRILIAH
jgi:PKD repeat protein